MKRAAPWEQTFTISSDDSSGSDSDDELTTRPDGIKNGGSLSSKGIMSERVLSVTLTSSCKLLFFFLNF